MKRIRRTELKRLQMLAARLTEEFAIPKRQSSTISRGDVRAIQYALWWIRSVVAAPGGPK